MRKYIKINEYYVQGQGWIKFYNNEKCFQDLFKNASQVNVIYINEVKNGNDNIVTSGQADIDIKEFNQNYKDVKTVQVRKQIENKQGNRKNYNLELEFTVFGDKVIKAVEKYLSLINYDMTNKVIRNI